MTKRWKCTVCGYLHEGETPPETCPVCGADRSKFIPLSAEQNGLIHEMISAFRLHPVLAHFPNGLMPTAVLFVCLSVVFNQARFEVAAFWLILTLIPVVPLSIASGVHDWHKYFGKRHAPVFYKKLCLALILFGLGLFAITLRFGHPGLLGSDAWQRWLYLLILLGMLACVGLLGHFGSLLAAQKAQAGRVTKPTDPKLNEPQRHDWTRDIVDHAPDAILVADTTGNIRYWNHGAERIFGVSANEAIGQSLNLIIPQNLRERHWEGWARVMQTGETRYSEAEMLRVPAIKDGERRFSAEFSIIMLKGNDGNINGIAAILRDVTDQWEREKTLKAQLDRCQQTSLQA